MLIIITNFHGLLINGFHFLHFQFGSKECFMDDDVYDHVTTVIRYHPRYFEHYLKTHKFVIYEDGPLPFDYRHYLAIMAAARHKCIYLIQLHEEEFLASGGNVKWLNGLEFIPPKLRAIYEINKILAHKPWMLTKEHIERLVKGNNNWSLSEAVHAIVLLAHFHSLSSFVFSCGLTQELDASLKPQKGDVIGDDVPEKKPSTTPPFIQKLLDQQKQNSQQVENGKRPPSNGQVVLEPKKALTNVIINANGTDNIDALMKRMQDLSEKKIVCSEVEMNNRFKSVELQVELSCKFNGKYFTNNLMNLQAAELGEQSAAIKNAVMPQISVYLEDPNYTYQDFAKRGSENTPRTFRIQDYSW